MSTRAGYYRAWAVGTVVWVGAITFLAVQAIPRNIAESRWIYIPSDPPTYQAYNLRSGIDNGIRVRRPDGSELYFHRSIPPYDENVAAIVEEFDRESWIRYWSFLYYPWMVLMALPGLLFILAYAMLWVSDGFGAKT